ncbi:hypothetical protein DFH28DRAFT_883051 [Melampsora americana]|nr:hypothetical protein DFH28DRAFT_883051 [Melampsora americana]
MVLPGEGIPSQSKKAKSSKPRNQGVASQRLADAQRREEQAAEGALLLLVEPSTNANKVNAQPVEQEQPLSPDRYEAFQRADEFEADDDPPPNPPPTHQYYQSITYQERTLREEAAWQVVIPKLFSAFMPCRKDTYQWGHPTLWNHDWNQPCRCREWQKVEVVVDAIDLTVRLVRMGYIGGTPTQPRTAFSCRMLRFHHTLWKYSSVRLTPFVEALDEFLDACNALFVSRNWRKLFSAAVDAYREMIRLEDGLASRALQLSPIEELASNCPSCFGPTVPGTREDEPNHYICLDANFQQRRHLSASALWRGETGVLPSLFISPAEVAVLERKDGSN